MFELLQFVPGKSASFEALDIAAVSLSIIAFVAFAYFNRKAEVNNK